MKKKAVGLYVVLNALVWGVSCMGVLRAQDLKEANRYSQFDATIGLINSGVFAGFAYKEEFRVLGSKHKFFYSPDFILGSVTYDGQEYFGYKMKYDVYGDALLLYYAGVYGSQAVQLIKDRVTEFEIEGHRFVNLSIQEDRELPASGFIEVLVEGDHFTFLKKHRKRILKKSDRKSLYHEFKDRRAYYMRLNDEMTQVKSLTHITALFPEYRKQINDLAAKYNELKKSDPEYYYISILSDFDTVFEPKTENDL
ncbi:MAG: hypothetical protein WBM98_08485 [Maribacter sp.]|uniref:hypothetical protein n=1 Tax=Maribacter sp. TaxID=1897614 RepID=UPI003C7575E9